MDFIERLRPTPEGSPPWIGIGFKDPLESDDLSARLLSAYPKGQTLRERKHLCTIHFLAQELWEMHSSSSNKHNTSDPLLDMIRNISDMLAQGNGAPSAAASSCASPSTSGSVHSPSLADLVQSSTRTHSNSRSAQPSSPNGSPQLLVWNMHDGRTLRTKTKRKMTQEERDAYKETRKRGACEKCKKNKGRCTHKAGQLSFTMMKPYPPPKRGLSAEIDNEQPGKALKTEPGSDIRHLNPSRHPFPSPISTHIAIKAPPTVQSPGATVEPSMDNGRRDIPGADALAADPSTSPPSEGGSSSSSNASTPTNIHASPPSDQTRC